MEKTSPTSGMVTDAEAAEWANDPALMHLTMLQAICLVAERNARLMAERERTLGLLEQSQAALRAARLVFGEMSQAPDGLWDKVAWNRLQVRDALDALDGALKDAGRGS